MSSSGAITTAIAILTFLIDGAVVKHIADLWAADPEGTSAIARLATEMGFVLVAGLQLGTGMVAGVFVIAGLRSHSHPAWLAVGTAVIAIIPGSVNYLFGAATWNVSASYVSNALFAVWILTMSRRIWVRQAAYQPVLLEIRCGCGHDPRIPALPEGPLGL